MSLVINTLFLKNYKTKTYKIISLNRFMSEITEKEQQEIKDSAKKLLDEFSSKLTKVSIKEKAKNKEINLRQEGKSWKTNQEFQELMFENAPYVENNLIIAEKGHWKK